MVTLINYARILGSLTVFLWGLVMLLRLLLGFWLLLSATYASQFKEFGGEVFEYESGQEIKSGRVMLRYNLVAPKEKHVFEYQLSEFNGEWRIINIVVDGISDLALKKAQYTSVIDREGFDALIARLGQKIEDYSKNSEG